MSEKETKSRLHWWIILGMLVGAVMGTFVHFRHFAASEEAAKVELFGQEFLQKNKQEQAKALMEKASRFEKAVLSKLEERSFLYSTFEFLADAFLNLLKMIVIPLVFFSLVSGMLGLGDIRQLGRIGVKTALLYVLTTTIACLTGLFLVNLVQPGAGLQIPIPEADEGLVEVPDSFKDIIVEMIPSNVVAAAASFDLIGVIVFTLFFGIFLVAIEESKRAAMVGFIEGGAEVMMKMTHFIIRLAPIGIAALIAGMVSRTGPGVFIDMIKYVLTVFGGLLIHVTLTLPLLIWLFTRRNPYRYLRVMSTALLTGFSTASSSGTLAVTMDRAENGAGISKRVTSFVLPLGATINMDGTALYEIVSVLFVAQVHAGIDPNFELTFAQQGLIVFLGLMVSIGAAGIPHAGLVMMVIILKAVGLPVEYTGVIWSVDRVLDMCRTATNIASDSSITLIVAHTENAIDESVLGDGGGPARPPPGAGVETAEAATGPPA